MKKQALNPLFLVSEIKVSYRPKFKASERPNITRSQDAYEIFIRKWDLDRIELSEQFFILLLNTDKKPLGIVEISSGGFAATFVDPKLVFSVALKACASSIILCHNHPSGNLKPSLEDIKLTTRLGDGAKILGMEVIDHLIITDETYYSFADDGMLR